MFFASYLNLNDLWVGVVWTYVQSQLCIVQALVGVCFVCSGVQVVDSVCISALFIVVLRDVMEENKKHIK